MKYLVHLLGSRLKTIALNISGIVHTGMTEQQKVTFSSEDGVSFKLLLTVPSKTSKDLTPTVNIWSLNNALQDAGLCEPDDRISSTMTQPGPVLHYCNKAVRAVTLGETSKDPDETAKENFEPSANTVDGDSASGQLDDTGDDAVDASEAMKTSNKPNETFASSEMASY